MGQEVRVSVIGESVLMEGVIVSLENNTQISVQRINAEMKDDFRLIAEFDPEVIIYALGHSDIEMLISAEWMKPDVRLIGLDLECNQVLIMDSHLHRSLSLEDLQKLITAHELAPIRSGEKGLSRQKITSSERVARISEG